MLSLMLITAHDESKVNYHLSLCDILEPHLAWVGGAWPCWGATGGLPGAPPPDLRRLLQDQELAAASASPPASPPSAASTEGVLDLGISNYIFSTSTACNEP